MVKIMNRYKQLVVFKCLHVIRTTEQQIDGLLAHG